MKKFDPIDVLFISLISCYLISFSGIVFYLIKRKKNDIKKTIKSTFDDVKFEFDEAKNITESGLNDKKKTTKKSSSKKGNVNKGKSNKSSSVKKSPNNSKRSFTPKSSTKKAIKKVAKKSKANTKKKKSKK